MKLVLWCLLFTAPSFAFASVVIRPSVSEGFFVCNAGVAHKALVGRICVNQQTGLSCNASDDSSCVCSNSAGGDDSLLVNWDDLTVAAASPLRSRSDLLTSSSTGAYNILFSDSIAWNNSITGLQINTSSEVYGTSYFVDFCYQGPIENIVKKNDTSEGIYSLNAGITARNLSTGAVYTQDSNLTMNLDVTCDLRQTGKYKDPRTATTFAPAGNSLEQDVVFSSAGYPRASSLSFSQRINSQNKTVPRFCVVRATFTEMAGSNTIKVRPANSNPTEFTVDLDISKGDGL